MASPEISPEDVLRFWLGEPGDPPLAKAPSWYKKDDAFDREISDRFLAAVERGVAGELADWKTTPRGRLALVILYDQLSRNIFRGTARSFAQDALARAVVKEALDAGDERMLSPTETSFLLMPLMHSEDLALQNECVARFTKLRDATSGADDAIKGSVESSLSYAQKHLAIIERFGRFPHRNAILGRPATPEEADFLKQPGSSF